VVEYLRVFRHVGFFRWLGENIATVDWEYDQESSLLGRERVSNRPAAPPTVPKRVGFAADHRDFALKEYLVGMLRGAGYEVLDFGDGAPRPDDEALAAAEHKTQQSNRCYETCRGGTDHGQ
jgi:hypothetical protein